MFFTISLLLRLHLPSHQNTLCSVLCFRCLIILFLSFLAVNSLIILAYVSHGSKSEVAYDVNRAAGWEDVYL